MPIKLPNGISGSQSSPGSKIVSIDASNLRSMVKTADGQVWHWGGYFYDGTKGNWSVKSNRAGFKLLNEEEGIPKGAKIASYGMGFAHDVVMVD